MLIDIHRHSSDKQDADIMLRNIFHTQTSEIASSGYYSVGLHPWHINIKDISESIEQVKYASRLSSVLAIGETGIDKAIDTDIDIQLKVFKKHIDIAKETKKVIVIHCVRAYDLLLSVMKEANHKHPWIIHWYNASPQMGSELIKKGAYLSFGHMLFKENSNAFKTFLNIPLDKLFFETDDADVSIWDVYTRASELKNIPLKKLEEQIENNFFTCFGIKL
ncbi:MAG: TatD family hydrolase [Bacteroidales bacterium]|nr:TatD family hydrolase [Bacteroidales bacterium]MBN2818609.1 TatD family hydrolase [Bacteroidales bacterium]